ncbi:hypothetical protein RX914_10975 [Pseudomonas syringae pv. actinidiae]|nr:hypothetical protein [Pseudomonas syringae pv. actinidiae]MDU8256596.1 hypothetical protein [Pseudomonas syringae pv. actinidiae]MDU8261182.1 hypothetical protein [Pseudomonas syringae pv. actinidiae]MDU8294139.1 hypothetical protein [Pseudomonas syringae pv. actinidiae]MDU8310067.1 hypothetical protein [Pseudomonas syringae pv. actinidiae]
MDSSQIHEIFLDLISSSDIKLVNGYSFDFFETDENGRFKLIKLVNYDDAALSVICVNYDEIEELISEFEPDMIKGYFSAKDLQTLNSYIITRVLQ